MRFKSLLLAAAFLAPAATSQTVLYESLTGWNHVGGPPNWSDNVTAAGSEFPKVDQLNSTQTLQYSSKAIALKQGSYVITFRVMKFKDNTGVAPLTAEAIVGGKRFSRKTPAKTIQIPVDPKTGKLKKPRWVWTDPLVFYVDKPSINVVFFLKNTDSKITKQNFYFDGVILGRVRDDKIVECQSMTLHCATTWGMPYTKRGVPEKTSPFGRIDHVQQGGGGTGLWWFHWHSRLFMLQPGVYTANVRAMKDTSLNNAQAIDLFTKVNGVKYLVTWNTTEQKLNKWVLTTGLTFRVTQPNTWVRLVFQSLSGQKDNYSLDYMLVRKGGFRLFGKGGITTPGWLTIKGNIPKLGKTLNIEVQFALKTAFLFFGRKELKPPMDLTPFGMGRCHLYTMPFLVTPGVMPNKNNVALFKIPIPNNPALIGANWFNQAMAIDKPMFINPVGIVTSNAAEVTLED